MASGNWLELSEAAQILGVHQSTLRRWADAGRVSHIRTLSGRRRFDPQEIKRVRAEMTTSAPAKAAEEIETQTLNLARRQTSRLSEQRTGWFGRLSEDQIMLFRYSGQRLLGLMMQFISREDGADTFLAEGKRVAGDYGMVCYKAGLSVSQTAEAFLYFRRSILESVLATTGLNGPNDKDGHRIFLRTSDFFDTLLVATIENYKRLEQTG